MAYTPHTIVKPEVVVNSMVGVLSQELTLLKLFSREGFEKFIGARGDKLIHRVPGRLPARRYAWRNDRSTPIEWDVYKEATAEVTWGDRVYSGVRITDEQAQFDLDNPNALMPIQAESVARTLNTEMASAVETAPYQWKIGGVEGAARAATVEARKILNKVGLPQQGRILVVGSDFEQAMLEEDKLTMANFVGDANASPALNDATLGRLSGFQVVVNQSIDPGSAYALVNTAFHAVTGAPYLPAGILGATTSYDGVALRWLRDYDPDFFVARSVVDAYFGTGYVRDRYLPTEQMIGEVPVDPDDTQEVFVRGVKLTLDGTSVYPEASSYVGEQTGLTTGWVKPTVTP